MDPKIPLEIHSSCFWKIFYPLVLSVYSSPHAQQKLWIHVFSLEASKEETLSCDNFIYAIWAFPTDIKTLSCIELYQRIATQFF